MFDSHNYAPDGRSPGTGGGHAQLVEARATIAVWKEFSRAEHWVTVGAAHFPTQRVVVMRGSAGRDAARSGRSSLVAAYLDTAPEWL